MILVRALEKEEQVRLHISTQEKIIKIRKETNEIERMTKSNRKKKQTKIGSFVFEKMSNINKPLAKQISRKQPTLIKLETK